MTLYICPTDHVGPLVVPKGTTVARVDNCPGLTSVTFPEGCTVAWVDNCPNATITRQRLEDAPVAQPPKEPGPVCFSGDC